MSNDYANLPGRSHGHSASLSTDDRSDIFSINLSVLLRLYDLDPVYFSSLVGVSPKTVYYWLDRLSLPTLAELKDIRRVLSLPDIDLIGTLQPYDYLLEIVSDNIIRSQQKRIDTLKSENDLLKKDNERLRSEIIKLNEVENKPTNTLPSISKVSYKNDSLSDLKYLLVSLGIIFFVFFLLLFLMGIDTPKHVSTRVSNASSAKVEELVYVTSSGEKYHRPTCRYVKNKSNVRSLSVSSAVSHGYEACSVCNP